MTTEHTYCKLIEIVESPDEYMAVIKERVRKIGSFSILGPPDLLHLTRVKTKTQFLSKPKRQIKSSYVFMIGLNIQNIAYLNSYVTRLLNLQRKQKSNNGDIQKAYFCVFDVFKRIDIHIEINIPGSTSIFGFNQNELKINVTQEMYISAYYSSTLRSMNIKHFPFLKIYDQICNRKFLTNFISAFVPFALVNFIEGTREVSPISVKSNMGINLLFKYLLSRDASVLLKTALETLKAKNEQLALLMSCEVEYSRENFRKVVKTAATVLVQNPTIATFLYIQARALLQCRRYNEAIKIARSIVFMGQGCHQVWVLLGKCYFYVKDYKTLLTLINTAITLTQQPEEYLNPTSRQKSKLEIPNSMLTCDSFNVIKPSTIRESSVLIDYYFKFDNWFFDKFGKIKSLIDNLKRLKKQMEIANFIERCDRTLKQKSSFYTILVMIEREKNWEYLMNLRNRVFWLESDFENIAQIICDNLMETGIQNTQYATFEPGQEINEKSFVQLNNDKEDNSPLKRKRNQSEKTEEDDTNKDKQKEIPKFVMEEEDRVEQRISRQEKSFEMDPSHLSQTEIKNLQAQQFLKQPEPCSSRNKQLLINEMYQQKQLCNTTLQKMFTSLYQDLLLQLELDNWIKLIPAPTAISSEKSEIIALTLVKKAFVNRKLMRYRKVEQTLKLALCYAKRNLTKIVSVHTLAEVYIETKNYKGAQNYLEELLVLLSELGLKQYDVIPYWLQQLALPIMNNIGSSQKIRSVMDKCRPGPLKDAFEICFRKFKTEQ